MHLPPPECAVTWDQIDFSHGIIRMRRIKNGIPSVHQIGGEEMRTLRAFKREDGNSRFVFMTERGAPMTPTGFRKLLSRLAVAAKFQLQHQRKAA
jgi:type 1 fimbriae regulatory protein FimB/type 1 fimbriae regulatory protein FimE